MASSREHRGAARKNDLSYRQSVEYDEYEDEHPNESSDRTYNRNALYHSEYTEDEDDGYDDEDDNNNVASISTSIPPPPPSRSKRLPSIPQYVPDKSRPSAPTPTHQKRKINYFTIGKSLTSRLKFKKSQTKEEETRNNESPLPEPPQNIQITLPSLAPSSPISHQLPAEYLDFEEETDNHSEVHTTPELTMDDLYHLFLNMQKGFQVQVEEMNSQIKELKREIKKLKGEEEESEEEEEEKNLEDFTIRSPSRTATSVRSVAKEMERYGGEGRWFHNEYS